MNPRGRIAKWWLRNLPAKLAVLVGTLAATLGFFGVVRSHPLSAAAPASTDTSAATTTATAPAVPTTPSVNNTAPRRSVPTPMPVARRSRRS